MKCYVTFHDEIDCCDRKVSFYGERNALLTVLASLGKSTILTNVDMVDDKEKENNG